MAKGKGFDPIADAHEVAEHNINPYHWLNKVTSFTYARWMAERKVAIFALPISAATLVLFILACARTAADRSMTLWAMLLDFGDGRALAIWAPLLLLVFVTGVYAVMLVQWWQSRGKAQPRTPRAPERKKKQPRRRKD